MKKHTFFLLIMLMSIVSFGQNWERNYSRHDIILSFGTPALESIQDFNSDMLNEVFPDERYVRDNYSGSGILSIGYRYLPKKNGNLMFGVNASYHNSSAEVYNLGQYLGDIKRQWVSFTADLQLRYLNMDKIQLYSGVDLGFTFGNEKLDSPAEIENTYGKLTGNINSVAWQINLIGLRAGSNLGGFFELGYGYKGIVNFGLSYQFY